LVNFLLFVKNIASYSKSDIDKGNTPLDVYKLCSCIRESFCLSYAIRKNNNLYLYFQNEHILIKFEGRTLRFVGPDERSQALLLEKALRRASEYSVSKNIKWIKSTPGILSRKFLNYIKFIEFYASISHGKNYLLLDDPQKVETELVLVKLNNNFKSIKENDSFIILTYNPPNINLRIMEMFKELKNIKVVFFPMIIPTEDKILYINFRKDYQSS
jgi:hypothetical protein